MLDVNIVIGSLAGALVAAALVFAVMAHGRRALQKEASDAQSARAVADSRLADLTTAHTALNEAHRQLNDEHLALSRERERLLTTLESVGQDLRRESTTATTLRGQLDERTRQHSQLESELRVVTSQNQGLISRLEEREVAVRLADEEGRRRMDQIAELKAQTAALEERRAALESLLGKQKTWIEEQTQFFEQKIGGIAGQLLEEKSRAFTEVNRKEIDAVVSPFREQLKEFRERVDHIYAADARDRGQMHEQILQLTNLNQAVSQQAQALTKALTISSKATGDWGEMILEKILEDSGLREGKEYTLQHTVEADDESLQRPDAVIFMPEGRQLVIDAKVSNKAWTDYCSASDDESRAAHLEEHLASLRAHIRGLSARDYPSSPDLQTVDFVLMFVPVEAALVTALARDESLYMEAYRKKIVLVTASTLMAVIRLVEGTWAFQKRKESADKIAEAGRKLYEKLTVFSNTFVEIGEAIERAHGTFEKAKGQLATGKGNTIRLAQKMVELGVTPAPGKVMPAALVDLAGEEADDPEEPTLPALEAPTAIASSPAA
jgi:DNA recombination protein RmuC